MTALDWLKYIGGLIVMMALGLAVGFAMIKWLDRE